MNIELDEIKCLIEENLALSRRERIEAREQSDPIKYRSSIDDYMKVFQYGFKTGYVYMCELLLDEIRLMEEEKMKDGLECLKAEAEGR